MALKSTLVSHTKNVLSWKTKRKIVTIGVDDYGNVRLHSKTAREKLKQLGFNLTNRFDLYDTLETTTDLEALYETLQSVKDKNSNHAIFTALTMTANIDFNKVEANNYDNYYYEPLNETFNKLNGYEQTWKTWKEGIDNKLIYPQFHGREHLNLQYFNYHLQKKTPDFINMLKLKSYVGTISETPFPTISSTRAFDIWKMEDNENLKEIIIDGLNMFEKLFGFRSEHFNPPGNTAHPILFKTAKEHGIKYIDTEIIKKEHQGQHKFKKSYNYTGKKNQFDQILFVKNCGFEPSNNKQTPDWYVTDTLRQIETAFKWGAPAMISTHRVNFCGKIEESNRTIGLSALKDLLQSIVKRWPDVEFMTTNELGNIIGNDTKR